MQHQATYTPADAVVCRYADKSTVLFYYIVALVLGGALIHLISGNETVRDVLARASHARDERKILISGFSLIWAAILIDFLLQLRAFLHDRPALVMTAHGVAGLHGGLWREIAWADLEEVEVTDRYIRLVRRPRNAFTQFVSGIQSAGSKRFRLGEYCIHVLLARIDGSKTEILRAVRDRRPDLL